MVGCAEAVDFRLPFSFLTIEARCGCLAVRVTSWMTPVPNMRSAAEDGWSGGGCNLARPAGHTRSCVPFLIFSWFTRTTRQASGRGGRRVAPCGRAHSARLRTAHLWLVVVQLQRAVCSFPFPSTILGGRWRSCCHLLFQKKSCCHFFFIFFKAF